MMLIENDDFLETDSDDLADFDDEVDLTLVT
jgi:hypothetical protein